MYSIVRFFRIKTDKKGTAATKARAQIAHDFRLIHEEFADPDKYEDNQVLALNEQLLTTESGGKYIPFRKESKNQKPQINFKQVFDDHIKKHCKNDFRIKSNAIHALEIMMTTSSKRPNNFDEVGWVKDSMKWCEDKFGKENIVFAVLHRDETTPHIHVQLIPAYDGVLNASKHIGKMEKNRELDRSYYEAVKKYGFKKREHPLHKKHISIGEFRRRIEKAMDEPIPQPDKNDSAEDYYKKMLEWEKNHNAQAFLELEKKKDEIREAIVDLRMEKRIIDEKELKINAHRKEYEDMEALRYMMKKGIVSDEYVDLINNLIKEGKKQISISRNEIKAEETDSISETHDRSER